MIRRAAAPCGALAASAWLARPRAEADGGAPKPARRFEREWRKLERLGSGAFAEVFLVERAGPQDGGGPGAAGPQRAAAKLMSAAHAGVLAREVGAMRRTGLHPNLVGLLDEYSDGAAREKRPVALVLELAAGGELFDWIVARGGGMSEQQAAVLVEAAARGLEHLHARGSEPPLSSRLRRAAIARELVARALVLSGT